MTTMASLPSHTRSRTLHPALQSWQNMPPTFSGIKQSCSCAVTLRKGNTAAHHGSHVNGTLYAHDFACSSYVMLLFAHCLRVACSGRSINMNMLYCLCRKAGFHPALTETRGFDHGTFVPLKLAFPAANIPVLQLSLLASMNAKVLPCPQCMPCFASTERRPS